MTPSRGPRYISVDELMPQVTLEQAAEYYGILLPELRRIGDETRTKCFLACGRSGETGDRTLAIQESDPSKRWACHHYGCTVRGGNLVSLCDLMKEGPSMGGRPRGDRFKEIVKDLAAIARGGESMTTDESPKSRAAAPARTSMDPPPRNRPLAESTNDRARRLVHLDEEFVRPDNIAIMSPAAASYFRQRPYLDADTCEQYRVGYLPMKSKSLLRGKIVYPYFDADGNLLTWFGRDPGYEEKHRKWLASDRSEADAIKTQFVRGFLRGQLVWGEHIVRSSEMMKPSSPLVVVEGPNDAIALQKRGARAVAICSNVVTVEQAEQIDKLYRDLGEPRGKVLLLFDNDAEGETGLKLSLPLLAEHVPVQQGWSRNKTYFRDRQPESLSSEEIKSLLHL